MADPSDVVTSQHIASFQAVLNQVDKPLAKIKPKAKDVLYFKNQLQELLQTRKKLADRIQKIESKVGTLPRKDNSVTSLINDLKGYKEAVEATSNVSHTTLYFFGSSQVKTAQALEGKVKSQLPQDSKGNASQAVNDAVLNRGKDASKAGSGMLHASAGKPGVSSCTVFFRRKDEKDGLETHLIVEAVGSHAGSSSYDIHWSNTSKLKAGKTFSL